MKGLLLIALTALSINAIAQIPTTGMTGWWTFTGNANDISGNGNNGTVNGANLTIDRFGNPNSAYQFNGTTDFVQMLNGGIGGGSSRTISFWAKTNATGEMVPIDYGDANGNGGTFQVQFNNGCSGVGLDVSNGVITRGGNSILDNSWHNIVVVLDATAQLDSVRFYVDGAMLPTITCGALNQTASINTVLTNPIRIGKVSAGNVRYFNGLLDDFISYNRALSQVEINQIYTATNTPCTIPISGLIGNYPFTGNANDLSGFANNGTVFGATLTTDRFGNPNSAYLFNGTSDYIQMVTGAVYGNTPRTVCFWAQTSSTGEMVPFDYGDANGNGGTYQIQFNNGCSGVGLDVSNGVITKGSSSILDNVWHNFIITLDTTIGSQLNNTVIYVDGNILSTITCGALNQSAIINTVNNNPIRIGKVSAGNVRYFSGKLDDFYIYNRVLTATEIADINCNSVVLGITITVEDNSYISIYPNPTSNYLNIQGNELSEIKIFDINGKLIENRKLNNVNTAKIDCSNIEQGIYFISITDSKSNIINKKLIIK